MKIAVYCEGATWGEVDEQALQRGLGGRETALVQLAMNWAAMGHDVYAFVPRSGTRISKLSKGTVTWASHYQAVDAIPVLHPDVFVSWENADILAAVREAGYDGLTGIEMQVAHLNTDIEVSSVADYVFVLSGWARDFFVRQHPDMRDKTVVFPNGVDIKRFDMSKHVPSVDGPVKCIYSSSPDRGLHHLLKMWPEIRYSIKEQHGRDAVLYVCYGIENFVGNARWSAREDGQRAVQILTSINQAGVDYCGKIGQHKLAQLMGACDLMLYPCDTMSPTETGCISIVEALASYTPVITTNCDCLGSEFGNVTFQVELPWNTNVAERFIANATDALEPALYVETSIKGRRFAEQRDWKLIAAQWIDFFEVNV